MLEMKTLTVNDKQYEIVDAEARNRLDTIHQEGIGVGRETVGGGEIFNDYENNEAIGDFTKAEGKNSRAGIFGYKLLTAYKISEGNYGITVQGKDAAEELAYETICFDGINHLYNELVVVDSYVQGNNSYLQVNCDASLTGIDVEDSDDPWENWVYCLGKPNPVGGIPVQSSEGAYASGINARAVGRSSFSRGRDTEAIGDYAHAEGRGTHASYAAHAEGVGSYANGYRSHAEGNNTRANGETSHAEGYNTFANGDCSHSEGWGTEAQEKYSHAEGSYSKAEGQSSHAEGNNTTATGTESHAEGYKSKAVGAYSHAEGYNTTASNAGAHTEGLSATASGQGAHAEGDRTTAFGQSSHAEGLSTKATGYYSHAEGEGTDATGMRSHAEGHSTYAQGEASHTEGYNTTASKKYAHSEGWSTYAQGEASHAQGRGTVASADFQHVMGKYNKSDSTKAVILGNGESDAKRSNAHAIDWEGNAWFAGGVTVGENNDVVALAKDIAPAGYGLGTDNITEINHDDLDNITSNGWYRIYGASYLIPNGHAGSILIRVDSFSTNDEKFCVQTSYSPLYGGISCVRTLDGKWSEWEWVNPPMELGKEYRTIERYDGAPIFTILISPGDAASGGVTTIEYPEDIANNILSVVRYSGTIDNKNVPNINANDLSNAYSAHMAVNNKNAIAFYGSQYEGKRINLQIWYIRGDVQ